MYLRDILRAYANSVELKALHKAIENDDNATDIAIDGLVASSTSMVFAALAKLGTPTTLFILSDSDTAGYFYNDLVQIAGDSDVLFFPSSFRRSVKYAQKDSGSEILRTEVMTRLLGANVEKTNAPLYIVTHPEAVAEYVISKKQVTENTVTLRKGQNIDTVELVKQLRANGFVEVDYVYEPGQIALRGSILDVYSFSSENPFRIDFFGDEIDTIRTFNVTDQLSCGECDSVNIVPELSQTTATERNSLFQFLPADALIAVDDYDYIHDIIGKVCDEGFSKQAIAEKLEDAPEAERKEIMERMKMENVIMSPTFFDSQCAKFRHILLAAGKMPNGNAKKEIIISFSTSQQPLFHKNFNLLRTALSDYATQGYALYLLSDSSKQQQRLREILNDVNYSAIENTLHQGFVDHRLKKCLFTDHQIFDRFHKYSLKSGVAHSGKMALTMKALHEMQIGDYIVHIDFGIGKFGGLVRVPTENGMQEVIRIVFKNNDIVDVSIHSLYKISKYRNGGSEQPPQLSTLGTGAWNRLKERTKKHIKDIARDLIKLYAKRRNEKGFAFSADDYMQHELEASFPYDDTPDQITATQSIKADMESSRPMDRLVCGDVGFGKTEIAVRAAFKAACDSKQTALLVPTTVLAFQHYQTFSERLKDFPVRIEYLSRARSAKQVKTILDDLAAGKIDILIGTHKILGKTVKWHDLGLLIVDEEQKFGVSTKEKLRKLKTNVDTITMSATPIPRTLQFSLMGARDMSIMRTPPPNRHPIQTQLTTFNRDVLIDAINMEMSRNGQVFIVNNRISKLPEIASVIKKYIPDCRIAIGHGRMKPDELEETIMGFVNYDYDVLLSTTIIENGIDIPNANTIIINDAQNFGLSDLHQMRGRVGRSNKKAFCYLMAPPKSALTTEARRRLEALETFSDLGSGFSLAMQDLDIRGAGNLLGAEQSGFIEDLGYEAYQKILSQAVTELKNDEFADLYALDIAQRKEMGGEEFVDDCAIDSDLEMYFPDSYVPGSSERILLYRELDNIADDNSLEKFRQRMVDRFGPLPTEGEELLQVVTLRRLGRHYGCEKIILRQSAMTLQFVGNDESPFYDSLSFGRIVNYAMSHPQQCNMRTHNGRNLLTLKGVPTVTEAVETLRRL